MTINNHPYAPNALAAARVLFRRFWWPVTDAQRDLEYRALRCVEEGDLRTLVGVFRESMNRSPGNTLGTEVWCQKATWWLNTVATACEYKAAKVAA